MSEGTLASRAATAVSGTFFLCLFAVTLMATASVHPCCWLLDRNVSRIGPDDKAVYGVASGFKHGSDAMPQPVPERRKLPPQTWDPYL